MRKAKIELDGEKAQTYWKKRALDYMKDKL